jgi:hypothetical protein
VELKQLQYETKSADLVRFRIDSLDEEVASIVRTVIVQGEQSCRDFRRAIDEDAASTLRLFAMRRTLQGRRNASLSLLGEAIDTYALLPTIDETFWESWVRATLFVARSLGISVEENARRFAESASESVVERFDVVVQAVQRIESLQECHIVEVATTYGTGFVEILVFLGKSTFGLRGAPRQRDNVLHYSPSTNLAQLAVSTADAMDATGRVSTGPIGQDQLAGVSFSQIVAGSYIPVEGCLSFNADGVGGTPSFSVLVSELFDDTDVLGLVDAANELDDQIAISSGTRLILLSALPDFEDEDVPVIDFGEFETIVTTALAVPLPLSNP